MLGLWVPAAIPNDAWKEKSQEEEEKIEVKLTFLASGGK